MTSPDLAELRRISRGCANSPVRAAVVHQDEQAHTRRLEAAGLIELEGGDGHSWWLATMTEAGLAAVEYDPDDDMRKSVAECFRAVKARKAAGGKGWEG